MDHAGNMCSPTSGLVDASTPSVMPSGPVKCERTMLKLIRERAEFAQENVQNCLDSTGSIGDNCFVLLARAVAVKIAGTETAGKNPSVTLHVSQSRHFEDS